MTRASDTRAAVEHWDDKGMTPAEIADLMGITERRVIQILDGIETKVPPRRTPLRAMPRSHQRLRTRGSVATSGHEARHHTRATRATRAAGRAAQHPTMRHLRRLQGPLPHRKPADLPGMQGRLQRTRQGTCRTHPRREGHTRGLPMRHRSGASSGEPRHWTSPRKADWTDTPLPGRLLTVCNGAPCAPLRSQHEKAT
jgi:hypothetical protein